MKIIPLHIRQQIAYDPLSGEFTRIHPRGQREAGARADRIDTHPHGGARYIISYKSKLYFASRVAWVMMTGEQPKGVIDHINRDRLDNRWENLRDVTVEENNKNKDEPQPTTYQRNLANFLKEKK